MDSIYTRAVYTVTDVGTTVKTKPQILLYSNCEVMFKYLFICIIRLLQM